MLNSVSLDEIKSIVNPELYSKTSNKEIKYTTQIEYPDAKKHQIVSFAKSGVRILGYGLLIGKFAYCGRSSYI